MRKGNADRRAAWAITASFVAVFAVAGCAQHAPPGREAEPRQRVDWAEPRQRVDCRSEPTSLPPIPEATTPDPAIPQPGRVPPGFEASAALRCTVEFGEPPASDGEAGFSWRIERFEGDLAPLLAALAAPDDGAPLHQACTADMELVPPLWLEGRGGDVIPVHYPRDSCGKTKPAVRDALEALEITEVERRESTDGRK